MTQAVPMQDPYRHVRLSTTIGVTYDLAMTADASTAAARITRLDLAQSELLTLAAEFDASGNPMMAQHARRVAREIEAEG